MVKKVNMRLVAGDPNEINPNDVLVTYSDSTGLPSGLIGPDFALCDAKVQTNAEATITVVEGTTEYEINIADILSNGYDALNGKITVTLA